jgi:glycosyltransferase involved in cell wall biosynthesis
MVRRVYYISQNGQRRLQQDLTEPQRATTRSSDERQNLNNLLTIVIPTFNEREAIGKVLDELFSIGLTNILVVDGHSSDGTLDVIKKYPVSIIFQRDRGKADALKTAFENVKTSYMMIMDGDFTYDPSCVYRFLEYIGLYDEIIGVRHPDKKNMRLLHKIGNKILTQTFNVVHGTNLSDICSGMYVLRAEIVKNIDVSSAGFEVEVEIAAHVASSGKIAEVPINYRQRIGKQKLCTWECGFKILNAILKSAINHR